MSKRGGNKSAGPDRDRAERLATLQRMQTRTERRDRWLVWGSAVLGVAVVIGVTTFAVVNQQAKESLSGVQTYKVEPAHVPGQVDYKQTPPAGGPHAPVWLNCGTYDREVPNENAVHSMEHGAVWITYQPDAPAGDVATLTDKLDVPYTILSPFEDLPAPVVASAWGTQLLLDGPDDPRLDAFLREYVQGPQAPEPGAACSGGTDGLDPTAGTPMDSSS